MSNVPQKHHRSQQSWRILLTTSILLLRFRIRQAERPFAAPGSVATVWGGAAKEWRVNSSPPPSFCAMPGPTLGGLCGAAWHIEKGRMA